MAIIVIAAGWLVLPECTPAGPMLDDPIEEGFFEADIMSHFFAFDPFMTKNLRSLGEEFLIEG